MNASTYLRMSAVLGKLGPCVEPRAVPGESGELIDGWEYFLGLCPNTDGCERLVSRACLVASLMESVEIEVTELCLALLVMDDDAMLGLSEPKFDCDCGKKLVSCCA